MAIYEFICHDCEVIWEREAPMSKAPSRSRCPECKKLKNRHWGDDPVTFNGNDYYTNKRTEHNINIVIAKRIDMHTVVGRRLKIKEKCLRKWVTR